MAWEIYLACSDGESVDADTYVKLHTVIDLGGLYDLLEMKVVHASHGSAAMANSRHDGGGY